MALFTWLTTAVVCNAGRSVTPTGAWVMSDDYVKTLTNASASKCAEEVKEWCAYRLDMKLVQELASLLGGASVTEFGAGLGRYARAMRALRGAGPQYTAYDGMPDIEQKSRGWTRHADLTDPQAKIAAADYVVTFEMAEHIPRKFEATLLANIDRAALKGVIISWSETNRGGGVGHVNAKKAFEVQRLFCERGYHFDSVASRRLRQRSYYWYFRKNILVFRRAQPAAQVNERTAKEMAKQGTDMRTCGERRQCCTNAPSPSCVRSPSCMTEHHPQPAIRNGASHAAST